MKKFIDLKKYKRVHFIGINGISMSALAKYLSAIGKTVTGSDAEFMPGDHFLDKKIKVYSGHQSSNVLGADLIVYTSAIKTDNPELLKAYKLGKKVVKRSELLGSIINTFKNSIAVSGSHGKTTTTAMIANIFLTAGRCPTAFIGGEDVKLSNFLYGTGDTAIVEACEYKKNFLDLSPTVSVILNIDDDHLDSYGNMENMIAAFNKFVSGTVAFINSDDENCNELFSNTAITFGINRPATYKATNVKKTAEGYSFSVLNSGVKKERINLKIKGKHNVYNALAAFAVSDYFGIDKKTIKFALENFSSVKRRAEEIGQIFGIPITADYAHHPKEIEATISALSEKNDKTLVVFQPHTYSRTRFLMDEFIDVLKDGYKVIIYKTYAARENFDECGSAYCLYLKLKETSNGEVFYANTPAELEERLYRERDEVSSILVLGAGDVYYVMKKLIGK